MLEVTWWQRALPALVGASAVVTLSMAAVTGRAAADPGGVGRRDCGGPGTREAAAAAVRTGSERPEFELEGRVDQDGGLAGYELRVARAGGTASVALPSEAFAAGPFGGAVMYGEDDGTRSRVRLLTPDGCDRPLLETDRIVRRATLDASADALYLHQLERGDRADLGVWRVSLVSGAVPERVLPPLPTREDDDYGITYSTEFAWSTDGSRLAVQSCGALRCRTRILEPSTRRLALVAGLDQGPLVGLADDALVTFAACRGLPCAVARTDVRTGQRSVLVASATRASMSVERGRPSLAIDELGRDGAERRSVIEIQPSQDEQEDARAPR